MLAKYVLIGILSVCVDYLGLYIAFSLINIEVKTAVTIAFFATAVFNYIANKKYTFNSAAKQMPTIGKYSLLVFAMYLLTLYIVSWLIAEGASVYVAKLLSIPIVFLISFITNKYFVYQ